MDALIRDEIIFMLMRVNHNKLSDEVFEAFENDNIEKAKKEVLKSSSPEDLDKISYNERKLLFVSYKKFMSIKNHLKKEIKNMK